MTRAASDCDCQAVGLDPVITVCDNPPSHVVLFTKVSITQHVHTPEVTEVKLGGEVCFLPGDKAWQVTRLCQPTDASSVFAKNPPSGLTLVNL